MNSAAMPLIAGHLPPDHPLSPRQALADLDPKLRWLLAYAPRSGWDTDTASLPRRLQRYRHQARAFAQTHLAPAALAIDAQAHWPVGQMAPEALAILKEAGRQGWLSDLLPHTGKIADRICVLNEGAFVAEFTAAEATQEKIMRSIVTSGVN